MATVPPPNFIDLNPVFDQIVTSQGADVQPGTVYAADWGAFAYGGTAGGHPTYGYRHLHQLYSLSADAKKKAVRAIIAMSCQRHCMYFGPDAEIRNDGYEIAWRPFGTQEKPYHYDPSDFLPNDAVDGGTLWPDPVNVGSWISWHGLDSQHAWSFLPDVMRLQNVTIPLLAGVPGYDTIDASALAWARLLFETFAIVGMVNNTNYLAPTGEIDNWSDRLSARMLQWPIQSYLIGALDYHLYNPYLTFVKAMVEYYKKAPGASRITKVLGAPAPYVQGDAYFQPHNLSQVAAAMYDIAQCLEGSILTTLQADLRAICKRIGQWIADCIQTSGPNAGVLPFGVKITGAVLTGINGAPVPSLAPYFTSGEAVRFYETFDDSPWGYRGLDCAGQTIIGCTDAATKAASMLTAYQADSSFWAYLVHADWSYAVAAAKAAAGE